MKDKMVMVVMPALSDTMATGRLVKWLKQPGDPVKKGESVAEVETDKAIMDVEVFRDGYLAGPLAALDTDIPVGQPIAYLADQPAEAPAAQGPVQKTLAPEAAEPTPAAGKQGEEAAGGGTETGAAIPEAEEAVQAETRETAGEAGEQAEGLPAVPRQAKPPKEAAPVAPSEIPGHGKAGVSPYARSLALDLGVDINQIRPGADGQIHAAEVLATALRGPEPRLEDGPPYTIERPSSMREAVARNMSATLATPTFHVSARIFLDAVEKAGKERELSLTLMLARAAALAVQDHPMFNAVYTARGIARRERVDIGVAVDLGDGLVTPVLRDMARRPISELAENWRTLHEKAQRQRLIPSDYSGATFYVSNLGVFPHVHRFDTIVPLGAAAILAVSAMNPQGTYFTLSCDHRMVFGADAARFLGTLKAYLEQPARWL